METIKKISSLYFIPVVVFACLIIFLVDSVKWYEEEESTPISFHFVDAFDNNEIDEILAINETLGIPGIILVAIPGGTFRMGDEDVVQIDRTVARRIDDLDGQRGGDPARIGHQVPNTLRKTS